MNVCGFAHQKNPFGSGAPQRVNVHTTDEVNQKDSGGADTHRWGSDTSSLSSSTPYWRDPSPWWVSQFPASDITVNWPVPGDGTVMKSHVLICSHSYTYLQWFSWCVVETGLRTMIPTQPSSTTNSRYINFVHRDFWSGIYVMSRDKEPLLPCLCLCVCVLSQSLASYHFIKLFSFGSGEKNNQVGNVDCHGYSLGCWKCSIYSLNMNPLHWGYEQNTARSASLLPFIGFYKEITAVVDSLSYGICGI